MAYDAALRQIVLFGAGFGRCDAIGETWTWNGHRWRPRTPDPPCPDGREWMGMDYDVARSQTVLFGGLSTCSSCPGMYDDTWTWNGATWSAIHVPPGPGVRYGPGMAYDASRKETVLFGGAGCLDYCVQDLGDTWIWDGSSWTNVVPPASPSPRTYPLMAYDAARHDVVLFGGIGDSGSSSETWTWDGTTWTMQSPSQHPPSGEAMAYDGARHEVVLFGTDASTWTWDGVTWTERLPATSPSARSGAPMAYDAARRVTVLFGGWDGSYPTDTWTWDGTNWTRMSPSASPPGRQNGAMAYDAVRHVVVLFGGWTCCVYGGDFSDTWEWDGLNWTQVGSGT